jgi:mRNA-degrading endonuclease toxin of MazEF toxin-antitoxin module
MMGFERWHVLTALFPFVDIPQRKPRPIVVLSERSFNDAHGVFIAAMITTAGKGPWPSDHPIADLAAAGLKVPSVVRWKLFTLPDDVVGRTIGTMGWADQAALATHLGRILPSSSANTPS